MNVHKLTGSTRCETVSTSSNRNGLQVIPGIACVEVLCKNLLATARISAVAFVVMIERLRKSMERKSLCFISVQVISGKRGRRCSRTWYGSQVFTNASRWPIVSRMKQGLPTPVSGTRIGNRIVQMMHNPVFLWANGWWSGGPSRVSPTSV